MYNKLMKWAGIIGIAVMALAVAAMLVYSYKKPLVYVQAADDGGGPDYGNNIQASFGEPKELAPTLKEDAENICIPVTNQITQESIHIDSNYVNRTLTIMVDGMCLDDVAPDKIYGSLGGVDQIQAADRDGQLIVVVFMDHIYEYEAILENQKLTLTLKTPAQIYDRIVVLDAGHGKKDRGLAANGVTESELTLDIANRVRELLAGENIRVYVTRTAQDEPDGAARIAIANDTGADMFVSLHLADGKDYGICARYNRFYFTPVLMNAELADLLVRETATAVNNRGNGVFALEHSGAAGDEDEEEALMFGVRVPAAYLELGAPGNAAEAELLGRDDYRQDLAYGICQAILKAYELMESR